MKTALTLATIAALVAVPAAAQQTRTKTYDGPNVSAETTTTVDREAGTIDRDRSATNKNTGETASSTFNRQRTETGAVVSGSQTGFKGRTRGFEGERVRNENGSTFEGTATGRGGQEYGLFGSRSRDGQGNSSASQRVTNSAGDTVYGRDRTTTRSNGQVNRTTNTTRKQGYKPRRANRRSPR